MINLKNILFVGVSALLLTSCIGDDIVEDTIEPEVRITNPIDTLERNTSYTFSALAFDDAGMQIDPNQVRWKSLDTSLIEIDSLSGEAFAKKLGTTAIEADITYGNVLYQDADIVHVGNTTVVQTVARTGSLRTTSSYTLRGDFTLIEENDALQLRLASNYAASSSLPGLYVYLTNNPNTVVNALEVGKAISFSGEHVYNLPAGTSINDYQYVLYFCKPFNVKVGDGEFDN